LATLPFPQERDVSKPPEPSSTSSNPRGGDGQFAKGSFGGPGWPRGAVQGAASALDQLAVEASTELIKVGIEPAREQPRGAILMNFMKFMRNGRECRCHKGFGRFLMKRCFSAPMAPEVLARPASLARNRVGFSRRGVSSDSSRARLF
jgi:hypothetical protein